MITGASSGIGLELAKPFAKSSHSLTPVARSESKLENLRRELDTCSVCVEVVIADIAEVNAAEKHVAEINQRKLVVDILVNNAGFHFSIWTL